jgi:hypothetical protein
MKNRFANAVQKTPTEWTYVNRSQAQKAAEKIQKKLIGKKLVQVDHNTWVYVGPGEEVKPVRKYNYMD